MKSSVMNPRYALIAMVLTLLLPKNARSGRRRREIQRIRVEKRISFPEARQLVEATFPSTGFTSNLSFADVLNKKKSVKSVVCQTDLTWVSSDTPVQTVRSVSLTLTARNFFLAYFYTSGPFICIFSKSSPDFSLCWLWLAHGSCVGPQNKIGHPAGCRFPCLVPAEYK